MISAATSANVLTNEFHLSYRLNACSEKLTLAPNDIDKKNTVLWRKNGEYFFSYGISLRMAGLESGLTENFKVSLLHGMTVPSQKVQCQFKLYF